MDVPQFFTLPEVAERLTVSEATLRRLIRKGEVHVVRLGRAVRVTSNELQRLAQVPQ